MPVDLDGLRLRGLAWNLARARARCTGLRRAGGRLVVRRAVVRPRLVRRVFMLFPFGLITIRAAGPGLATFTLIIFYYPLLRFYRFGARRNARNIDGAGCAGAQV